MLEIIQYVEGSGVVVSISARKRIILVVTPVLIMNLYGGVGIAAISIVVPAMSKSTSASSKTALALQSYLLSFEYKRAFLFTRISLVAVLL